MAKITKVISAEMIGEEVVVVAENDMGLTVKQTYPISDPRAEQLLEAANEFVAKQEKEALEAKEQERIQAEQANAKKEEAPSKMDLGFNAEDGLDEFKSKTDAEAEKIKGNLEGTKKAEAPLKMDLGFFAEDGLGEFKSKTNAEAEKIKVNLEDVNLEGAEKVEASKNKKSVSKKFKVAVGTLLGIGAVGIGGLCLLNSCNKEDEKGHREAPVIEQEQEQEQEDKTEEVIVLTADDVRDIANNAIAYLNDDLGLKISPESIQAYTFLKGQRFMTPEEAAKLIESKFIPSDPRDMMATSLPASSTINRNNAMAINTPGMTIVNYSIFSTPQDTRTVELDNAFYNETVELQRLCAIVESSTATKEEKDAAKAAIEAIWTSFEAYGGLNNEQTNLPMDHVNSTIEGAFDSLQMLQPYSVAAGIAGVSQSRINFASGEGRDASVVFVDFSTMYNTTEKNLGLACDGEYTQPSLTK